MEAIDLATLGLRLWLGAVMLAHGINHARSIDGTASWFRGVGFRSSRLQARASAAGEIAIGLGLVLGLLTSVAAAGIVATMLVAFWSIHRFAGFFVFHRPDEGWEYVATLAVAAVVLAMLGPGDVSTDTAVGIADTLDGWAGAGVAGVGGLAVGALQLAGFWRRPAQGDETDDVS